METEERRQRGRYSPLEGRLCVKTGEQGEAPMKNAAEANPTRVSPGFFAIDRGAFRCAAVGGLNAAVAHLVMARGTGRDNRTTRSMHSIEQRTGISRPNATTHRQRNNPIQQQRGQ
jgi:hypothetical protein